MIPSQSQGCEGVVSVKYQSYQALENIVSLFIKQHNRELTVRLTIKTKPVCFFLFSGLLIYNVIFI